MTDKLRQLEEAFLAYKAPKERRGPAVRPRLAGSLVLWRGQRDNPQILMGCRHPRHKFMPSVFVFPGGAVDRGDSFAPCADQLSLRDESVLTACMSEARARATALACVRETFEETGLALGRFGEADRCPNHPGWQAYLKYGRVPELREFEVLARAITPPYRGKRFDTWFFISRFEDDDGARVSDSAELQDVDWYSLEHAENKLEIHPMTRLVLAYVEARLKRDNPGPDIPFMRTLHGRRRFERFP